MAPGPVRMSTENLAYRDSIPRPSSLQPVAILTEVQLGNLYSRTVRFHAEERHECDSNGNCELRRGRLLCESDVGRRTEVLRQGEQDQLKSWWIFKTEKFDVTS